jgi:hypothetical protein
MNADWAWAGSRWCTRAPPAHTQMARLMLDVLTPAPAGVGEEDQWQASLHRDMRPGRKPISS